MFIFITGFVGVCCLYLISHKKPKQNVHSPNIEMLKNALLTLCLAKVCQNDFDNKSMNYEVFDGTKLPMMSGVDLQHACFTYIVDKDKMKQSPFYTKHMENKVVAIEKYLYTQFDTQQAVIDAFSRFIDCIDSKNTE